MTLSLQPVRLTPEQKEPAARVLARAFQDDPLMKFAVPDDVRREVFVAWLMKAMLSYSLLYGEVYATPEVEGVACWLSPGHTRLTVRGILRSGMFALRSKLSVAETLRFLANERYTDRVHVRALPAAHWYLWAIGVDPACQGRGIGGRLLAPVLEKADRDGLCCYLETHNGRNPPFYEKYGFEVVSEGEVPGRGLRVWGMVRRGCF